ncbi:hypothetical protein O3P69_001518 [Scylla paramamosain]|uniref:Uncharacterized protein n=1 Tax=Scylla paramamosain TaxID=85552 RepID=A0AAW0V279_SCYPA
MWRDYFAHQVGWVLEVVMACSLAALSLPLSLDPATPRRWCWPPAGGSNRRRRGTVLKRSGTGRGRGGGEERSCEQDATLELTRKRRTATLTQKPCGTPASAWPCLADSGTQDAALQGRKGRPRLCSAGGSLVRARLTMGSGRQGRQGRDRQPLDPRCHLGLAP